MDRRTVIFLAAVLVCVGTVGCQSEERSDDPALAKVGSTEFRASDVEERFEALAYVARKPYKGDEGRKKLLQKMVEEEVFFQAAKAAGYENLPDVVKEVNHVRRNAMLRNYYKIEVLDKAVPTAEYVDTYYREHIEEFRTDPRVRVRHVLTKTATQAEKVRELAEMGRDFERLAADRSIDEKTKNDGGLIPGYLSPGQKVPLHGSLPEIVEAAVLLSEGEISPVVQTHMGYHVLKAEEVHPGGLLPLGDVRNQISQRARDRRAPELYDLKRIELSERFGAEIYTAEDAEPRTVEDLFDLAQKAATPQDRIKHYEQVLNQYPDDPRVYEAQFMIGFTYSEELKDLDRARIAFETVVSRYPGCDLFDSAKWMLENLGTDAFPPDTLSMPAGADVKSEVK